MTAKIVRTSRDGLEEFKKRRLPRVWLNHKTPYAKEGEESEKPSIASDSSFRDGRAKRRSWPATITKVTTQGRGEK